MITLEEEHTIGIGTRRTCYVHPEEPGQCIKIPTPDRMGVKQQLREVKYYRALQKRGVDFTHLAAFLGTVSTNRGVGYVYEFVRDRDGGHSKCLGDYFRESPERRPELVGLLGELGRYLLEERIIIYDFNGSNILCQQTGDGGTRLVVIDGIGDTVLIPVLNLLRSGTEKKIRRRWTRSVNRMKGHYPWLEDYPLELPAP